MWVFFREARRVLRLRHRDRRARPRTPTPGLPILVCCRHAGPGDSFMLIHALMHWYDREPRVVLKDTLAWDPMIDVLLHRIPARFITPNPAAGQDLEAQIADAGHRARRERRVRDLPRGRQLHRAAAGSAASTGCASSAWSGWPSAPRR